MAVAYPYPDGEVKVTLETSSGQVIVLRGVVVDMAINVNYVDYNLFDGTHIPGVSTTEYELTIKGIGAAYSTQQYGRKVLEERKAPEWACDHCGHINPKSARYCGSEDEHVKGCGASRSFIYDV